MTNTNVTHDPQRVLADLRAALEECKCERDELRYDLRQARIALRVYADPLNWHDHISALAGDPRAYAMTALQITDLERQP